MKKLVVLLISIIGFTSFAQSENGSNVLPDVNNTAFKKGEMLKYRIHYGFVDAGEAVIRVLDEEKNIKGREVLHVEGKGRSKGMFDFFFKVRDTYESYIDEKSLVPWKFVRRVNEGGYKIEQDYYFDHFSKNVNNGNGKYFDTPVGVQDMISAFYYARTMDLRGVKKGDTFKMPCFLDDEIWDLEMKYLGTETINADIGTINCLKFAPVVQKGRIFENDEDLVVYISNDKNRIPVQAKAKILVGSVKMNLIEYSGLANTFSSKVD